MRSRFLSFAMIGGVCFLLLVSLTLESVLKAFSHYVQSLFPGGIVIAMAVYLIFDFAVVVLLFAIIFKFLPDVKMHWRDVWIGAILTAVFFGAGKWLLGLCLGSGTAGSAYGAASSLITLLLWVYYSAQILLFGAEFTQVYVDRARASNDTRRTRGSTGNKRSRILTALKIRLKRAFSDAASWLGWADNPLSASSSSALAFL